MNKSRRIERQGERQYDVTWDSGIIGVNQQNLKTEGEKNRSDEEAFDRSRKKKPEGLENEIGNCRKENEIGKKSRVMKNEKNEKKRGEGERRQRLETPEKKRCRYYEKGNCKYGDGCRYKHEQKQGNEERHRHRQSGFKDVKECSFYKKGRCKFGDKCKYNHQIKENSSNTHIQMQPEQRQQQFHFLWENLGQTMLQMARW